MSSEEIWNHVYLYIESYLLPLKLPLGILQMETSNHHKLPVEICYVSILWGRHCILPFFYTKHKEHCTSAFSFGAMLSDSVLTLIQYKSEFVMLFLHVRDNKMFRYRCRKTSLGFNLHRQKIFQYVSKLLGSWKLDGKKFINKKCSFRTFIFVQ